MSRRSSKSSVLNRLGEVMHPSSRMPEFSKSVQGRKSAQSLLAKCFCSGYLTKEKVKVIGTTWKKCFVIVKDASIHYFDDAYSHKPSRSRSLIGYNRVVKLDSPDHTGKCWPPNSFAICYLEPDADHPDIPLQAASPDERQVWIEGIKKALLVARQKLGSFDDEEFISGGKPIFSATPKIRESLAMYIESTDNNEYGDEDELAYSKIEADKMNSQEGYLQPAASPKQVVESPHPKRPSKPDQLHKGALSHKRRPPHTPVPLPQIPDTEHTGSHMLDIMKDIKSHALVKTNPQFCLPAESGETKYIDRQLSRSCSVECRLDADDLDEIHPFDHSSDRGQHLVKENAKQSGVKSLTNRIGKLMKELPGGGRAADSDKSRDKQRSVDGNDGSSDEDAEGYVDMDPENPSEQWKQPVHRRDDPEEISPRDYPSDRRQHPFEENSKQGGIKSLVKQLENTMKKPPGGGASAVDQNEDDDSIGYVDMDPLNPPPELQKPFDPQKRDAVGKKTPSRPVKPLNLNATRKKKGAKPPIPEKPAQKGQNAWRAQSHQQDGFSLSDSDDDIGDKPILHPRSKFSNKEPWIPKMYCQSDDGHEIMMSVIGFDHRDDTDSEGELESEEERAQQLAFDSVNVSECFFYDEGGKAASLLRRQALDGSFMIRPSQCNTEWEMVVYSDMQVIKLPIYFYDDGTIGLIKQPDACKEEDRFGSYVVLLNYCRQHDILLASHKRLRLTAPHESCCYQRE